MWTGALRETAAGIRGANGTRLTVRNHPLPLTEAESVQLDSVLLVLAALFVLVPFCLLSGAWPCAHAVVPLESTAAVSVQMHVLSWHRVTWSSAACPLGHCHSTVRSVSGVLFMPLPFEALQGAGSYCIAPVSERMSGAMHLQMLSGCPGAVYWLGHYLWDLAAHIAVCTASLFIFWVCSCAQQRCPPSRMLEWHRFRGHPCAGHKHRDAAAGLGHAMLEAAAVVLPGSASVGRADQLSEDQDHPWCLQAYGDAATTGSWEQAGATFLLLFLYGAAVIPLVYLYSFGFSTPSACQVSLSCTDCTNRHIGPSHWPASCCGL